MGVAVAGPPTASQQNATIEAAAEAIRLAQVDARASRELAARALDEASATGNPRAASMAERALGLAAIEFGEIDAAVGHLRTAVRLAERAELATCAAEARMSLSRALSLEGRTDRALAEADRAVAVLRGPAGARAQMQRALLLQKAGRTDPALDGYRRALTALRRHGDRLWEARLLCNRGVLQVYRGVLGAAETDLRRAEALHSELGNELAVTQVHHNLAWLAARRGDLPAALAFYDRVDAEYRRLGVPRGLLLLDRCEVLVAARLADEARAAAEQAVAELESGGSGADAAEARLMLAHAAVLAGDPQAGRAEAERARAAFVRQQRDEWAVLARYAGLRAAWLGGERSARGAATADSVADELEAAGWQVAALDARLIAGRTALAVGRLAAAEQILALAGRARRRGPVELRMHAWHAEALRRLARGERRAAQAAIAAGLRALETHRATLGASELRAQASAHGNDLALLGLRLALDSGRPARVLAAAERWRASALRLPRTRPPDDPILAAALQELRRIAAAIGEAVLEGGHSGPLVRRQAALEQEVRRRSLHAAGGDRLDPPKLPSHGALLDALEDRAMVELIAVEGRLHAIVLAGGRCRLRALAPVDAVVRELESLRFGLRRLASRHGTPRSLAALAEASEIAARRLDDQLLAPVRHEVGDRPLVAVPTGVLHALPWSLLPSCRGRSVTVAASAALWHRAQQAAGSGWAEPERVALVAGPELPGAVEEIDALLRGYPGAACLTGAAASAAATGTALARADCAHVAAHGTFRGDNPLFSCLQLADGPLTVYDLEALPRVPRQLVLSACDSGRSAVRAGDELVGLAGALLGLGTTTLVASVAPVPDADTRDLMLALHRELAAGTAPAEALARAQTGLVGDPLDVARWAGFVCFGAG